MPEKPTILFLALIPPDYSPFMASTYGMQRTFDLLPHKLAILALVAWLREHGCEGFYSWADSSDPNSADVLAQAIKRIKPHALGFSLTTEEFMAHYMVIEQLKARFPQIPVIIGGPHVAAQPEHTLKTFPAIDYVAVGEGEQTLDELLRAVALGVDAERLRDIKGIAFRDPDGGIVVTGPRVNIEDINILPDPAYDLIFDPNSPPDQRSTFPLVCSYGCYFHCTFCSVPHGYYRCLTPERVVDRMQRLQEHYGVEYFAIRDSFWPPKREWLDEFCDEVDKRALRIKFHFQTRAGVLTQAQFERLRKIGAQAVGIGVEAGDPVILKAIKKGITIDQARKTFAALHKSGIFSIAFFIFGNKGENRKTIQASIDLSRELNGAASFYFVLAPLPGAEAFESVPEDQKDWWMHGGPPSICELSPAELNRLAGEAFLRYPLRWAYLWQHVLDGKLAPEFRRIARRVVTIHTRKYLLGVSERITPIGSMIRWLKHRRLPK
jgi:radical SAM superfamily enzyme YgiQ (UPF0313 family)